MLTATLSRTFILFVLVDCVEKMVMGERRVKMVIF